MDAKYLQEIKAREQAATPGPWEFYCYGRYEDHDEAVFENPIDEYEISVKEDAAFIAHARTDIPALAAEIERLQKLYTALAEDMAAMTKHKNTLEKALRMACGKIGGGLVSRGDEWYDYYIRQVQEQEAADHA